ncbi:hypothetical protein F5Y10DRAFT_261609 [Nemania abortiva]|nr:hypothetical protein F5Y10DRAFT_261609 [Nemania abortiva]
MEESELLLADTLSSLRLDDLPTKYQKLRDEYRRAKRKFSKAFEASDNEIRKFNRAKKPGDEGSKEHERLVYGAVRAKYHAYVEGLEEVRYLLSRILKKLVKDYRLGNLPLNRYVFEELVDTLEGRITVATRRKIIAQASPYAVQGAMVDEAIYGTAPGRLSLDGEPDVEENVKWAYIDRLICRFRNPEGVICSLSNQAPDDDSQERFRADVMKEYGALRGEKHSLSKVAWCVISGRFWPEHMVVAANIVGCNLGEASANYIFGRAGKALINGHLMSPQNSLPMLKEYEELLEDGNLIFEPVDKDATAWKVIVLDEWLRASSVTEFCIPVVGDRGDVIPWASGLHERKLSFVNSFRPYRQYLYFASCLNILRRQRLQGPGWWKDFSSNNKAIWATTGQYLRRSTIKLMAHLIGHLNENDAAIMAMEFPNIRGDNSDADTARLDDVVASKLLLKQDKRPRREQEDYDD